MNPMGSFSTKHKEGRLSGSEPRRKETRHEIAEFDNADNVDIYRTDRRRAKL